VAEGGPHIGVAQHAGQLTRARLAPDDLDVAGRDPASRPLRHHQMVIGVRPDLREVGDHERLAAPRRSLRYCRKRLPHARAHLTPDTLVHLVEYQGRHGIVLRQDDLQGQHQARQLAS